MAWLEDLVEEYKQLPTAGKVMVAGSIVAVAVIGYSVARSKTTSSSLAPSGSATGSATGGATGGTATTLPTTSTTPLTAVTSPTTAPVTSAATPSGALTVSPHALITNAVSAPPPAAFVMKPTATVSIAPHITSSQIPASVVSSVTLPPSFTNTAITGTTATPSAWSRAVPAQTPTAWSRAVALPPPVPITSHPTIHGLIRGSRNAPIAS